MLRRQHLHPLLGQRIHRAVHKGRQPVRQLLQPKDHRIIQHCAGGQVAVRTRSRLAPVPEEQLIAMHPAMQIQNRLPRHRAQIRILLRICSSRTMLPWRASPSRVSPTLYIVAWRRNVSAFPRQDPSSGKISCLYGEDLAHTSAASRVPLPAGNRLIAVQSSP